MGLKPLEFSDCISDSPWFRQNLREHEVALDEAYKNIKRIETQCRDLIICNKQLSGAQRSFARALGEFKMETVGTTQTDDERMISTCLKDFAKYINQIEDERQKIISDSEAQYLEPIKRFRTDAIGRVINEEKERYRNESRKFYQNLEKHLHLSTVRKSELDFREADAQLDAQQHNFCKASLHYVTEIQSVQERMKFEFVETLSSFMYSWMSFYHVGHVIHEDFKPFLNNIQERVHNTKESYQATISEAEDLKQRILKTHTRNSNNSKNNGHAPLLSIKQGYIFMLEKARFPKTISRDVLVKWTKYYCVYSKETRMVTLIPVTSSVKTVISQLISNIPQDMKGTLGQSIYFKLKECIRKSSDSIDKRFCFDVVSDEKGETITFQAMSEEDRRQWLDAMDGRQQDFPSGQRPSCSGITAHLDDTGFEFINSCITALEGRGGIREQGLYRNCGVTSKVQKLMQLGLDKRKSSNDKVNVSDEAEWETKTVSSAVKTFLRNLPEPLMTFDLHNLFINAAKLDDGRTRVDHIHYYVHQLPSEHRRMLEIIIRHLKKVSDNCSENLMTIGNLGVCFGPTLLRPKEETMAAIMDIKFCNVVVEVLITNYNQIFNTQPPASLSQPCPPKPDHRIAHAENTFFPTTTYRTVIRPTEDRSNGKVGTIPIAATTQAFMVKPKSTGMNSPAIRTKSPKAATATTSSSTDHIYAAVSSETSPSTSPKPNKQIQDDSSDSLNSMQSHESEYLKLSGVVLAAEAKAKICPSYAPPYNPVACETGQRAPSVSLSESLTQPARATLMSFINPTSNMQPSRRVKTLYACTPDHESELCFQPGQIITNVYESKEDGWLVGTLNGKTGLIPSNYVEPLP